MRSETLIAALLLVGCEGSIIGERPIAPKVDANRVVCDDKKHAATTEMHRLTPSQYQRAVAEIFAGRVRASLNYPQQFGSSVTGFSTEPGMNDVGEQGAQQLMRAADDVAVEFRASIDQLLPCAAMPSPGQTCLDTYFSTYARRAFRRTLTSDEKTALQNVYDFSRADDADFRDAVAVTTSALMQSPQFLYIVEDAAGSGRQLTGVELASRLSFLLWDSIPDDELLALGESEQLTDPQMLASQARRLLADNRADAAIARYVREWTQASQLVSTDKDPSAFPYFSAAYASSLNESFDRFVVAQVRGGANLNQLLTSDEVMVDDQIAASFGVTAPPAPGMWVKAKVDPSRYAGLFTHPLLLATNAHPTDSSFVFRGRMVQKRMLCTPMGAAPANAQAVFASLPLPPQPTAAEVSERIQSNTTCATCHRLMDPTGLAFEHFDGAGRWRDGYASGRSIDTAGILRGVKNELAFQTPTELARLVSEQPEAAACASAQLFRFTFSRVETEADGCALQKVNDVLSTGGNVQSALLALTTTDAFTWRADP
ncbi:MAG: DUF1592 domain-containing protein [Archangium sp.]|nr:DUF1592 domain-containing protein [Archangium sp.]